MRRLRSVCGLPSQTPLTISLPASPSQGLAQKKQLQNATRLIPIPSRTENSILFPESHTRSFLSFCWHLLRYLPTPPLPPRSSFLSVSLSLFSRFRLPSHPMFSLFSLSPSGRGRQLSAGTARSARGAERIESWKSNRTRTKGDDVCEFIWPIVRGLPKRVIKTLC